MIFRSLMVFSLLLLLVGSCSKEKGGILDETIWIRHKGADMPAYVHGNPEEKNFLVTLHGAGSYGLSFRTRAFTEWMEERFVVVYWDQRGQSMSQGRYSKPESIIDLMVEDVIALIDVLEYKYGNDINIYLMGHSWGGFLGTRVLLEPGMQDRVKGWIAVAAAVDIPLANQQRIPVMYSIADEQIAAGNSLPEWKEIENELAGKDPEDEDDYKEILKTAAKTMNLLVETGVIKPKTSSELFQITLFENNPVNWLVSNFFNQPIKEAIENDLSLTSRLPEITIPVLLIYGRYDVSVPIAVGYSAYFNLGSGNRELVIFTESMHHPFDTEPEQFFEEVGSFILDNP